MLHRRPGDIALFNALRQSSREQAGRFVLVGVAMMIVGFATRFGRPLDEAVSSVMVFLNAVKEPGTAVLITLALFSAACLPWQRTRRFAPHYASEVAGTLATVLAVVDGATIGLLLAEALYVGVGASTTNWPEVVPLLLTLMVASITGIGLIVVVTIIGSLGGALDAKQDPAP